MSTKIQSHSSTSLLNVQESCGGCKLLLCINELTTMVQE